MDLCPQLISLLSFSPVAPVSGGFTTKPHKFRVLTHSCILTVLWVRSLGALEWVSKGYSLVAQMVKSLPAMHETWVRSLGWENPLEKGIATHSSTLAWKIPWMEEPGGLQSVGSQSQAWLCRFSGSSVLAWRIPWTEETALELFPVVQNPFISSQLWSSLRCCGHQLEVTQCPGLPSVPTTWPPPQAIRNLESFFPKAQPAKVDFFMMSCGQWGASQRFALIFHWSESSYRHCPQWRGRAAPGWGCLGLWDVPSIAWLTDLGSSPRSQHSPSCLFQLPGSC